MRSISIIGSRGVSPSEDHSIRASRGVPLSEDHEECLYQRITRNVSIGGSQGVSPSESTRSVSIRVPIIVGFLGPTSLKVHTLELPQISRELIVVARLEVARPELARPELVVARPEVARPEQFVARPKLARPELVVAHSEVARPELVVARPEVRNEPVRVEVRTTIGDKVGKELLHLAPMKLGILKKELFEDPKVRKAIIDRVPTPTQLLRAEGLTLKELYDHFQPDANNQPIILRSKTLIIVRVDEQEAQFPVHVEHLSVELARPKEANHALEKANHSRCKKYKKYKAKRDSLVLEKEILENELLEILAASIEKFEIQKLKNVIIEHERDLV
ncbi:hypothetical protein Tco_1532149 [Tanacetum coccineum]